MKIAQIVSTYPPYYGGMGNVVFQTASGLAALGHEVEVLTPAPYADQEIKPVTEEPALTHVDALQEQINYARHLEPTLRYGNASYLPQIKNELDQFDLVHLHYPFFGTANLIRKWKKRNPHKPLVITYHMDTRGPGWKGLFFKYYNKYWMPRILGVADKLVVSSFDYLQSSQASGMYKQNQEKWMELTFGVDNERFQPRQKSEALLLRNNLNSDLPTLLFVGGMDSAHYFKGISVLLQALALIRERERDFKFQAILVGEGDLRRDFEVQTKILGLNNIVHFTGKISNEELPYYYNLADLFVLPSINQGEAFGTVLLEAMASGVPVVASNLPGVRTVAQDGGVVVEPNNVADLARTIYEYFADHEKMSKMKGLVREVVEKKYSWGPIVEKLSNLYIKLVK